jgi:hypothetical protein
LFVQWNLPLEHTWPCHPAKMEGFIEKAEFRKRTRLVAKFGDESNKGQSQLFFWSPASPFGIRLPSKLNVEPREIL